MRSAQGPAPDTLLPPAGAEEPYDDAYFVRSPASLSTPRPSSISGLIHHDDAAATPPASLPPAAMRVSMASPPNAAWPARPGASPGLSLLTRRWRNFSHERAAFNPEITSPRATGPFLIVVNAALFGPELSRCSRQQTAVQRISRRSRILCDGSLYEPIAVAKVSGGNRSCALAGLPRAECSAWLGVDFGVKA